MKNFKEKELKDLSNIVGGETNGLDVQITVNWKRDEQGYLVTTFDLNIVNRK